MHIEAPVFLSTDTEKHQNERQGKSCTSGNNAEIISSFSLSNNSDERRPFCCCSFNATLQLAHVFFQLKCQLSTVVYLNI